MTEKFNWESYSFSSDSTTVGFKNAKIDSAGHQQICANAIRVKKDNRLGFSIQSGINRQIGDEHFAIALQLAKHGSECNSQFAEPSDYNHFDTYDQDIKDLSTDQMLEIVHDAIQKIKKVSSDAVIDAEMSKDDVMISIQNSMGIDTGYKRSVVSFYVGVEIIEGTSFFYLGDSLSRKRFKQIDLDRVLQRVIAGLELSRIEQSIQTGTYPIVLTPHAAMAILFILQYGLNGHSFYRGVSPLRDRRGVKICDERFSLLDDPTVLESPFSSQFDDEGVPTRKKYLIKNGVLKNILTDLESSARLNIEPKGNGIRSKGFFYASRDYASLPSPTPLNWSVSEGTTRYTDLLASIENGILIDQVLGMHTGNLLNGDFSVNISSGYSIKKGKIQGRVKDAVLAGNVYTMLLERLVECSLEREQIDNAGIHTIPYMVFKDMSIACG